MSDLRARASAARAELTETEAAFAAVRAAMVEQLLASTPTDAALREKLYLAVQSLDAVKTALRQVIDAGEIERAAEEVREAFRPRNVVDMPFAARR